MKEEEKKRLAAKSNYAAVLEKIVATRKNLGVSQITIADHIKIGESGYFKIEKWKN
jgi:DNA-binding XRE family transcriptional regulator